MTIKDIAEALNISISTVSKALNDATDIAEDTKATIRRYAESMGYHLKSRSKESKKILAMYERVDTDIRNHVLTHVISSFIDVATQNNFEVVTDTVSSKPVDFKLDEYIKQNNYCAAFVVGMNFKSPIYRQLRNVTVPLVLLDNRVSNAPNISSISSDNMAAIVSAVRYLSKLGHKRIGFLMGEIGSLVSAERLAGFVIGLAQIGQYFKNEDVFYGDFTKECGIKAAEFFAKTDVTAVISCSDIMAMGLIDGFNALNREVPNDISVIGFDDLSILKFTPYNLTTLKQDFDKMGENAFTQITEMLDGRASRHVYLPCTLIERGTVKPLTEEVAN